jgi:Ras-related protein Rab-6A
MIMGNKADLAAERLIDSATAASKFSELGLTYMEVSAKSGHNIKEFFRELSSVIAGGKKAKEESASKQTSSNPVEQPVKSSTGTMSLSRAENVEGEGRKKKKCC